MRNDIISNKLKSWLIILGFVAFVGGLGWFFNNWVNNSLFTIGIFAGASIYALVMYFAGTKISLAVNGAKEIKESDNPRLWNIVKELSQAENLPMPRVFIMNDPAPNAFATGRNPKNAAVCATTGILEIMDDTELRGVFAHEMGHVKNYDIRVSMIAAALTIVVSFIADMIITSTFFGGGDDEEDRGPFGMVLVILGALLAPFIAMLIQLAITRRREYLADATGAATTRHPEGLASALEKIGAYGSATRTQNTSTAHLFFANPLSGRALMGLFSTHPPVQDRVRRLREMANDA